MDASGRWGSVRVRQDLIDRVAKALNTAEAKREGFTNISQYTDHVLREALAEMERQRFEHVNMYEDHVKVLDNHIGNQGRIVAIYFKHDIGPMCDYCEMPDCVHIQYAWEIGDVREVLERRGLKPPESRL